MEPLWRLRRGRMEDRMETANRAAGPVTSLAISPLISLLINPGIRLQACLEINRADHMTIRRAKPAPRPGRGRL